MAIREEQDRRVGFNPEKLLTLEEAARQSGIPADDLEAMIREKNLPTFRLGGRLLRVRWGDVEGLQPKKVNGQPHAGRSPAARDPFWERARDFLYFNDFYLVAFLIFLTLLAVILTL